MLLWILLTVISIITYMKWKHRYWKNRGLPQFDPKLLVGDTKWDITYAEHIRTFYQYLKDRKYKHGGFYFFLRPIYVPIDIDIIKTILLKNFDSFMDRGLFVSNKETDPLSANLFSLDGNEWKPLRMKLSPVFTSAKIKMMFETILDCTTGLSDILNKHSLSKNPLDCKDLFSRFSIDVISSCAFGLECDATKDPNSEVSKHIQTVFESSFAGRVRVVATQILPKQILSLLNLKFVTDDVEQFIINFVTQVVNDREKSQIYRKDFIHLLLQIKNRGETCEDDKIIDKNGSIQPTLDMIDITAQCFAFLVAGFDTTATTMTFTLFELAVHQDMQETLRKDILGILSRHDNKYTYESISEMDYLERIIKESLRKYPPGAGLDRRCTKPFQIPGTDLILEEGTHVHIPTYAIHMDPDYYPDPEKFDPERFTKENSANRPACTWLPFGEGPRNCIGMRFGMFECKVAIATIICKHRITLNGKTRLPLVIDPGSVVITTPKGGIWLNITNLE